MGRAMQPADRLVGSGREQGERLTQCVCVCVCAVCVCCVCVCVCVCSVCETANSMMLHALLFA